MTGLRARLQQNERIWSLFFVLVLSSLFSVVLYFYRVHLSGHPTYQFLVWNLFLAWIPLWCAFFMWRIDRSAHRLRPLLIVLFCCWLLFFPNAPYIITDLQHVGIRWPIPIWYDLALVFTFSWNGLILGFVSLWIVQGLVADRFGRTIGWLLAVLALLAGSFGIYLGRILRFNSWDVFVEPGLVLPNILARITDPLNHPPTVSVTLIYALVLSMVYLTLTILAGAHTIWEQQSSQSRNSSNS